MPFQPTQGAPPPAAPPPAFPPSGPPARQAMPPPPGPGPSPWAQPAAYGPPPVTAGSLLTRSLQVWWQNVGKLVALTLVTMVPLIVLFAVLFGVAAAKGYMPAGGANADPGRFLAFFAVVMVLALVVMLPIGMIVLGGVNYGVIQWLAGRPAGVGDMLRQGARRMWGLLLAVLLVGLAVTGGYVLLIVPGIMIAVATSLALPAVTVEGLGAVDGFKRSLDLTRGHRWSIFAAFLAILALNFAISLLGALLGIIPIVGVLMNLAISLVTATIPYVLPAVVYHDLRVAKEGVDTSQLAQVFE
jgi:hypothetical protein